MVQEPTRDLAADAEWRFEGNAAVLALFPDLARTGISLTVHPCDEMFRFFYYEHGCDNDRAIVLYLSSGAALWSTMRQVIEWRFGSLTKVTRLLDFASGFGRVTRHMISELPADRVWVSDIYADAVGFQQKQLGVHGFVSTPLPEELDCNESFDVIVVSSLFTHLPAATFEPWLKRLGSLLTPSGLLMFSVHDERLLGQSAELPGSGILFHEISESARLPKEQYGTAWVSEDFVREAVRNVFGECSIQRVPRGFASYQDLYVVVPDRSVNLPPLGLRRQADGFLERAELDDGCHLLLEGWVADRLTGLVPREVRVCIDGRLQSRSMDLAERPDVAVAFPGDPVIGAGFRLRVELPRAWSPASLLSIHAVTQTGEEALLYSDRIEAALLRSARLELLGRELLTQELRACEARLAETERRLADAQRRGAELEEQRTRLQATVEWMQASRFWKLRNRWFALKRALRLTTEP